MRRKQRAWVAVAALLAAAWIGLPTLSGTGPVDDIVDIGEPVQIGPVGLAGVALDRIDPGAMLHVRPYGAHEDVEAMWDYDVGTTITVYVEPGVADANAIFFSNVFQLQIYLDSPEHDLVLYRSARRTWVVTPDFELVEESVFTSLNCPDGIIQFHIPYYSDEMTAFVSLTWDPEHEQTYPTPIPGLDYIAYEIDQIATIPWQQTEVWRRQQRGQVQESEFKWWPALIPEEAAANGLYHGWPKTVGKTTYWEYSAATGFAKKVHVDTNGNGKVDPGEPNGYIGRCPYPDGRNSQTMEDGSANWISMYDEKGVRIRYVFDGAKVIATHETYNEKTGKWEPTPGKKPIVGGPYKTPEDVPGPKAFEKQ